MGARGTDASSTIGGTCALWSRFVVWKRGAGAVSRCAGRGKENWEFRDLRAGGGARLVGEKQETGVRREYRI